MSRQMKEGIFKIAHNTQPWWGFTLQRGHTYGLYKGVCYVSAAEPSPAKMDQIVVYEQSRTKDCYHWARRTIRRDSDLGCLIIDAICASPYDGVTFREERIDLEHWTPRYPTMSQSRRGHYNPRPPAPKMVKTWVDQICGEAMT